MTVDGAWLIYGPNDTVAHMRWLRAWLECITEAGNHYSYSSLLVVCIIIRKTALFETMLVPRAAPVMQYESG